ncbi:hypothetical protein HYG89_11735 [Acinetobacter sp. SwsAc5]|uniref:hypothetical protein n=1 Tax=Acinetobacter sp. SwsAc5 TaxID=2749438 RepID=UPI0015C12951|nr:hypothetical protein [Acinetobacter sp. SwsAc5]NWK53204.1 hypothetical protein [Acinetobacter sp. SwsAc5]
MQNILEYFSKHKMVTAVIAIALGASLGVSLELAKVMNVRGVLVWSGCFGIFVVLWLHGKSFFSTENLGPYYSRLYGFGFGLIYTSLVFYLFTFYAGQQNEFFNKIAYATFFSVGIYNFLVNNYAGIEKQHLIAKTMLDKKIAQQEKEAKEKLAAESNIEAKK